MLELVGTFQHLHIVWCGPQSGLLLRCTLLALAAAAAAAATNTSNTSNTSSSCTRCGADGGDHKHRVPTGSAVLLFGVLGVWVPWRGPRVPIRGESKETVHQFHFRSRALAVYDCGAEDAVAVKADQRPHRSRDGVDG